MDSTVFENSSKFFCIQRNLLLWHGELVPALQDAAPSPQLRSARLLLTRSARSARRAGLPGL